jgi:hypothetical protein
MLDQSYKLFFEAWWKGQSLFSGTLLEFLAGSLSCISSFCATFHAEVA